MEQFRRQFVLAPTSDSRTAGWGVYPLRRYGVVMAQRDLQVIQESRSGLEITLVGYIVDARKPSASNEMVLQSLLAQTESAKEVLELSASLGGRWVMIAVDRKRGILFTDPLGLREVFYLVNRESWCASQTRHIAGPLGLRVDGGVQRGFMNSAFFREHPECYWPGDLTPYSEIRHLTPNHFLDLDAMACERFWPSRRIGQKTIDASVKEAAPLLEGLLSAAYHRFPLALPITAGYDSRTILAGTRTFANQIFHYTLRPHDMGENHQDLQVPAELLRHLGLEHHQIPCTLETSADFWMAYSESVSPAHNAASRFAQGLSRSYPPDRVSLSGHGGEVFRSFYYAGQEHPMSMDGRLLAERAGMGGIPEAETCFEDWLKGAERSASAAGVAILDLFYWENRVGRWAANGQAQWDIVHERFTPFDCREMLECLLSVNVEHRQAPNYSLNRRIIDALWPELLQVPFNPVSNHGSRPQGISQASRHMASKARSWARRLISNVRRKREVTHLVDIC